MTPQVIPAFVSSSIMAKKAGSIKIISGGQTGADRAALDAAIESGLPCGGYCPLGRLAEDGRIPRRYPLTESLSSIYLVRTLQNILCSDATVCFHHGEMEGGTAKTADFCRLHNKPLLLIDAATTSAPRASARLLTFVRKHRPRTLNVAGSRRSKCRTIYAYTRTVLDAALPKLSSGSKTVVKGKSRKTGRRQRPK